MRRFTAFLIITIMLTGLSGCAAVPRGPEKYTVCIYDAFDTVITLSVYCESEDELQRFYSAAQSEFTRLHRLFDVYNGYPGINNIHTVNECAGRKAVEVEPEIISLLLMAKDAYELTGGRVNVAMGCVLSLWHEAREQSSALPEEDAVLPDGEKLREAARHCDIDKLIIDEKAGTVYLAESEMRLDVGAVAKGYATERVGELLMAEGFESFVINAGGNVRCVGSKPDGTAWSVAVTDPLRAESAALGTVSILSGSAVTSGSYQRYFVCDGRRYHHIIDPDSLYPEDRFLSVTVLTENSALADALSTALFNTEAEAGFALVESLEGTEAMWILPDGSELFSSGFKLN